MKSKNKQGYQKPKKKKAKRPAYRGKSYIEIMADIKDFDRQ